MTNENNAEHPGTPQRSTPASSASLTNPATLPTLATLHIAPDGSIGVAAMPSMYVSETLYRSVLATYNQFRDLAQPPSLAPPHHPISGSSAYVTPHMRAVQKLAKKVNDLQERKEIAGLEKRIEELEVQLVRCEAEKEELKREKYELELLQPRCQDCRVAFNRKKEDGSIEIKASQGATKCSPQLGNQWCFNLYKARYTANRRAKNKPQD